MRRRSFLLSPVLLVLAGCGRGVPTTAPPPPATAPDARRTGTLLAVRRRRTAAFPASTATGFPQLRAGQPYVYVVDYQRAIRVVDPIRAAVVGDLPVGWGALPIFSVDGSRLYVTHYPERDGKGGAQLDVFAIPSGRRLASMTGLALMSYKIWGPPIIAASRDGQTLYLHGRQIVSPPGAAGQDTCWIARFDVSTGRLSPRTILLPACHVAPLLLAASGRTLYSGPWLIDLSKTPPVVHDDAALADRAVVQSPDGRRLYALDRRGSVAIWDADAGRLLRTLPAVIPAYGSALYQSLSALQVRSDGSRLYLATDDGDRDDQWFKAVVTIDIAGGSRLAEVRPPQPFQSFAVSPDGASLYLVPRPTGSTSGGTLEIWNTATGAHRATVAGVGRDAGPILAPPAVS